MQEAKTRMSYQFKGLRANIQGGIGSQLLRLISCAGEAIKYGIQPENVMVEVNKYSQLETNYKDLKYHNTQNISDYITTGMNLTSRQHNTTKTIPKSYNFDTKMVDLCSHWIKNKSRHKYITFNSHKALDQNKIAEIRNTHLLWVRGKDRLSNLKLFESIANQLKHKCIIRVISNDKELINQSKILKPYYQQAESIEDFTSLIYAGHIYTQMSGFCIAPFLISDQEQCLSLLDKSLHDSNDFPFLSKDWNFFTSIINEKAKESQGKSIRIIKPYS